MGKKILTEMTWSYISKETVYRLDIRQFSFSQRTVNEQNRLPSDSVGASSVNIFKNKIDIHLRVGYT